MPSFVRYGREFHVDDSLVHAPVNWKVMETFFSNLYPESVQSILLLIVAVDKPVGFFRTINRRKLREEIAPLFRKYKNHDFYFAVNGGRKKDDVKYIYAFFLDFNEPDIDVNEALRGFKKPDAIITTPRGKQVYWFFKEPVENTPEMQKWYEKTLKKMAYKAGANLSVTNIAAKMRLPESPCPIVSKGWQ